MHDDRRGSASAPLESDLAGDRLPPRRHQVRNMLLFAACMGLNYLAAPISYVGIVQAALCNKLGATPVEANLPGSAYMALTIMPIFIVWLLPRVSQLKPTLVTCFSVAAVMTALVPLVLASALSPRVKIAMVIAHAAVFGATNPTAVALMWEVLGRGVEQSRRGWALSLAFGAGPVLAVIASLGSQLLLDGRLGSISLPQLTFPWNFIALFGAVVPLMALAAFLSSLFVVPLPQQEPERQPFVQGIFGGLWKFLTDRLLLTTTIVIVLVYMGNAISSNMNLHTPQALGESPEKYAGFQNALRFGFKVVAGVLLGWLVAKSHPKAGLLTTASLYVLAQVWAIFAVGPWYLVAFGIYGTGELVGVYAPNYILAASRESDFRRNQAFHTLMMVPAAFAGVMFGGIAKQVGEQFGPAFGFRTSFAVCAAMMLMGIALAVWKLPARPVPSEETRDR